MSGNIGGIGGMTLHNSYASGTSYREQKANLDFIYELTGKISEAAQEILKAGGTIERVVLELYRIEQQMVSNASPAQQIIIHSHIQAHINRYKYQA
mgnify:CR=1 FL=1